MNRLIQALSLAFYCLYFSAPAHAQSWQWGRGHTGNVSYGHVAATDSAGNVFAGGIGLGLGTSYFGTVPLPCVSASTLFFQAVWAKYNGAGTALWAAGTQQGCAQLISLTADNAGNLIAFGCFVTPSITIGTTVLTNSYGIPVPGAVDSNGRYFLAKYDANGTFLWAVAGCNVKYENYGLWYINKNPSKAVTTDNAGNIYITGGFFRPSATIGTYTLPNADPTGNTQDIFVAKYDPSGSVVWAKSYGGNGDDIPLAITTVPSGDIYITGAFYSTSLAFGTSVLSNPWGGGTWHTDDAFLARLDPSGSALWATAAGGNRDDFAVCLAHDAAGNIYWTGLFADTTLTVGATVITRAYLPDFWATGFTSAFLVKVTPANTVAWGKSFSTPRRDVNPYSVATACDRVWVMLTYADTLDIDGHKIQKIPLAWGLEDRCPLVAGFDLAGNYITSSGINRYAGGYDVEGDIACARTGEVYMCGTYCNSVTVGPSNLVTMGEHHIFTAKFGNFVPDTAFSSIDTILCGAASLSLAGPTGYSSWLWDNATTAPTRSVSTSGVYWLLSGSGVCVGHTSVDTFNVSVGLGDTTSALYDTAFCASAGPVNLTGPPGCTSYLWNTGSTSPFITANTSGMYTVTGRSGCDTKIDSFALTVHPSPAAAITEQKKSCNPSLLFTALAPGQNCLWNTGEKTDSIKVNSSGTYWVQVADANGCTNNDTIAISIDLTAHNFLVNVTPDKVITYGGSVQLNADSGTMYRWEPADGSLNNANINNPVATPLTPTTYTVYAFDKNGCRDTARVKIDVIFDDIFIPSAFSPNGDGLNDVFRIGNLRYFKLANIEVFNRWGQPVFAATDGTNKGWNGTFRGVEQEVGTYYYLVEITRPDGEHRVYKGDVTLIR